MILVTGLDRPKVDGIWQDFHADIAYIVEVIGSLLALAQTASGIGHLNMAHHPLPCNEINGLMLTINL